MTGMARAGTILVCDGCFTLATGLPAECEDGCWTAHIRGHRHGQ